MMRALTFLEKSFLFVTKLAKNGQKGQKTQKPKIIKNLEIGTNIAHGVRMMPELLSVCLSAEKLENY